jgi:hypothetical protein
MQVKELLIGIPLILFVVWIFLAPLPEQRIERACSPITWVGNLATSTTALTKEENAHTAAPWADKLNYSCQYMIWRLFYQKDYNDAIRTGRIRPTGEVLPAQAPTQVAPVTAPPQDPTEEKQ